MSGKTDLSALTDELYARPPAEFVGRRDELARQARASGDRTLATQIKALRKPSVGAWYLNSGVRAGLAGLGDVLQLGRELRDAQERGDFAALRELGSRRGALTSAALRELGVHLAGVGVAATPAGLEEARTTLASALADPDVAEQLSQGRLDKPHVYAGFGDLSMMTVAPRAAAAPKPDVTSASEESAEAEEAKARAAAEAAARQEVADAEAELAGRVAGREAAEADVAAATRRLEALTQALADAREELQAAKREAAAAEKGESSARKRVERARRALPDGDS